MDKAQETQENGLVLGQARTGQDMAGQGRTGQSRLGQAAVMRMPGQCSPA